MIGLRFLGTLLLGFAPVAAGAAPRVESAAAHCYTDQWSKNAVVMKDPASILGSGETVGGLSLTIAGFATTYKPAPGPLSVVILARNTLAAPVIVERYPRVNFFATLDFQGREVGADKKALPQEINGPFMIEIPSGETRRIGTFLYSAAPLAPGPYISIGNVTVGVVDPQKRVYHITLTSNALTQAVPSCSGYPWLPD